MADVLSDFVRKVSRLHTGKVDDLCGKYLVFWCRVDRDEQEQDEPLWFDDQPEVPTIYVDVDEGTLLYDHKGNELRLRRKIGFV